MIGQKILHYEIIEKLGEGGMGVVYKAEDTKLKRKVAIKFLPHQIGTSDEERQRFNIEAQAAAALNHQNIATVHNIEEVDGDTFIVMEYIKGKELKEVTTKSELLSIDVVTDYTTQIAEGLKVAHEEGVTHRDIKSANIMITEKGQVKIMDFGLAKVRGAAHVTKAGTTLGTAAYMSPEQARGEEADHRSDIWSFGIVLYEMLTGQMPFTGDYEAMVTYSIVNDEPTDPKDLRPEIPTDLANIVRQMLAKNPADRFSSVAELLNELHSLRSDSSTQRPVSQFRRPMIFIPIILVTLVVVIVAWWFIQRSSQQNWVHEKALPELQRLIDDEDFFSALRLAEKIEAIAPDDPTLLESWPQFSSSVSINTSAENAVVYIKPYTSLGNGNWDHLGTTPIKDIRIPRRLLLWKIEKPGFETFEIAASARAELNFDLQKEGTVPPGMVKVPSDSVKLILFGMPDLPAVTVDEFFIDMYEVTNKKYKKFVDNGGYLNEVYWKFPFIQNDGELSWKTALSEFTDETGRPGPANWELGNFPEGKENHPVTGISWFEAAAYAEFVGKELPTIYHWIKASSHSARSDFIPQSNYNREGTSPVGTHQNIGFFGTYDMAGNVREWCFNQSGEERFILGGSYNDPSYMFSYSNYYTPFDRSLENGFRCIKPVSNEVPLSSRIYESLKPEPVRDFSKETPVSDEIFAIYQKLYDYDKTELNARVQSVDTTARFWRKETITFDAAYDSERMTAYLFLPKNSKPPYQTIVVFPGSNALWRRSSEEVKNLNSFDGAEFTIKSGRAVIYPVYEWMYERGDEETTNTWSTIEGPEIWLRDLIIKWRKDLGRTIDYLSTRDDIDTDKLCFYGSSLGSMLSPIYLTVEDRFSLAYFRIGGLPLSTSQPEVDPFHFAPRVNVPVLMLNGKFDVLFPVKESQQSLYELLGVPEEQKRMVHFNIGHSIPRPKNQVIKETLDWLDKYFGPVK